MFPTTRPSRFVVLYQQRFSTIDGVFAQALSIVRYVCSCSAVYFSAVAGYVSAIDRKRLQPFGGNCLPFCISCPQLAVLPSHAMLRYTLRSVTVDHGPCPRRHVLHTVDDECGGGQPKHVSIARMPASKRSIIFYGGV